MKIFFKFNKQIATSNTSYFSVLSLLFLLITSFSVSAFDHEHSAWTNLLQAHIKVLNNGQSSQVDYLGFKQNRSKLQVYLNSLSVVSEKDFSSFTKGEQKSFLINAYNAFTIDLILTKYPDLESINDLGRLFINPWKKRFIDLFGKTISLDDIEHGKLRNSDTYDDPRIHFAVNCASIGCPPLREEAFIASKIDAQLDEQSTRFLSDHTRNRFDEKNMELNVSKIFKWYDDDFEKGYRGIESLEQFFAGYAEQLTDSKTAQEVIRSQQVDIKFLDYDWRLNDTQ